MYSTVHRKERPDVKSLAVIGDQTLENSKNTKDVSLRCRRLLIVIETVIERSVSEGATRKGNDLLYRQEDY